ncbi:hypothetical protein H4S07_005337, partial [Coemansia furcata]
MDTSTVSVYHHTSRQEEQQLQVQNQFINELYPMATGGNPALSPSPVLHSGLDNSMGSSYTTSPLVGLQQAPASVPSQIHHMGMGSPFGSHNNLPSSTPMTSSIPTQQHFGGLALDGVAIDSTACVLYSPNAALGHPHHHNGGVPSNTPRMSLFGDQALGVPTGPSYPSNIQPRDGLGGVLFDTHALGNFQSQGMFGDLSSYSSPNSSQQLGMMPPTPISAPFANHHNATVNVAAAIATAQSVADTTGPLGLSLQAPTSLFNHHHQHYSPVPLGTVNSAPPDMLEFPHDVLRTQCSVNERQISTSPYYGPSAAHTPAPSAASNSGSKVNIARRSRMHHGTTEHRYRRKSELMATELIAGAVGGAASVEGSNFGSTANSNSAGVGGGARCVSSTLPENPFYRYEHVFSINDKAEQQQQQQQPPPPLRRQAVSSHSHLSMPLGFAAARGGSVSVTPFLAAPGFKAKVGAKRVPGAATPLRMSACENALGLVGGNNGAGQVATVDTPALSLQCSEDEDGNGSRKV